MGVMKRKDLKVSRATEKAKARNFLRVPLLPFDKAQPEMQRPVLHIPNPYESYPRPMEDREEKTPATERGVWTIDI